ncbi:hypothetical protein HKO22_06210 [Peptoniphilus sp. AGMB00490]|uniref:EamA-like transporter family n=1 Tax=Peptoniphilus faecalis TaxID=2731255 RepID=A0A848RES8_9FIRM|nr:hypothetical protein [Peptoniphilus faecalis]NMW85330.1 hypothetical protein [Peptoniphilus faecalis]
MEEVVSNGSTNRADLAKKKLDSTYFKKGIKVGIYSGVTYGLYTAFVTTATTYGVWAGWYGEKSPLSAMAVAFILGTLATGINDLLSAFWAIVNALIKGKFEDFVKTVKTKPGLIMIFAAIVGAPIAGVAYVLAIVAGGPVVIPIAGLNVSIGAILGRVIFKQKLSPRMIFGILICFIASAIIGVSGLSGEIKPGMILGMIMAFIAAFGWGLEGTIAGFGTAMIDSEIGIAIRQTTSTIFNFLIVLPILGIIEGSGVSLIASLTTTALTDKTVLIFLISGLFTFLTFNTWYKGNSMCGTALGMALNGTYAFFGPFFCWIILGVILKNPGYELAPTTWFASLLMAFGIFIMSVNPLDYIKGGNK